jgi:hypothetical protein
MDEDANTVPLTLAVGFVTTSDDHDRDERSIYRSSKLATDIANRLAWRPRQRSRPLRAKSWTRTGDYESS